MKKALAVACTLVLLVAFMATAARGGSGAPRVLRTDAQPVSLAGWGKSVGLELRLARERQEAADAAAAAEAARKAEEARRAEEAARAAAATQRASRSQPAARPVPAGGGSARSYPWASVAPLIQGCECSSGHCNGSYRGYFQFSYTTWRSAGGNGDPEAASFGEQYSRGEWLYTHADPRGQWPVCYPRALAQLARH